HRALAAAIDKKWSTGNERDAVRDGLLHPRRGVDRIAQRHPGEESAGRGGPISASFEVMLERAEHDRALSAVERANALDLSRQLAGVAVLVDDRLIEHAGTEIGGLLGNLHLRDQSGRADDPTAPHARREHL